MLASCTAIWIVPGVTTFAAGTVACSCVEESTDVAIAVPFHVIESPFAKPTPVAVKVKAALPAATVYGLIDVRLNVCEELPVIIRVIASEVVVSGLMTRMVALPAEAICSAVTAVVSCVFETAFVDCATPFHRI